MTAEQSTPGIIAGKIGGGRERREEEKGEEREERGGGERGERGREGGGESSLAWQPRVWLVLWRTDMKEVSQYPWGCPTLGRSALKEGVQLYWPVTTRHGPS